MENNNSVSYVARINEIKEIPGADNIEQGIIGGWNCIIKKGDYKISLAQIMREDPLNNIMSVGLRVEKIK